MPLPAFACCRVPPWAPPTPFPGGGYAFLEGGRFPEDIVARGDVSPAGMKRKCDWVLDTMEYRMKRLGTGWKHATVTQVYTVHDIHALVPRIQQRIHPSTITRHYCRPPISELEFEMDVRGVSVERAI